MATIERTASLILLSVLLAVGTTGATYVSPLKFLLMVGSGSSTDSSAVVSAVNQTLEEINADSSILPRHRLEYVLRDTRVRITAVSICKIAI